MEPIRKKDVEQEHRVDIDTLSDIADDARQLKDRYLDETIVPEGGE